MISLKTQNNVINNIFQNSDEFTKFHNMFCADYISSFVYHAILTAGIQNFHQDSKNKNTSTTSFFMNPVLIGALSGFFGAASVYPFDFVRQSQNLKFRHSLSTIPYSGVFFGVYFLNRNPNDLKDQCKWAVASSLLACLAEIPFDKAKLSLMGSRKTMMIANGIYVPFSAMMLVMYDKATIRFYEKK